MNSQKNAVYDEKALSTAEDALKTAVAEVQQSIEQLVLKLIEKEVVGSESRLELPDRTISALPNMPPQFTVIVDQASRLRDVKTQLSKLITTLEAA